MLEMQAVIGRIQLKRMADWTRVRNEHANALRTAFLPFSGDYGPVRVPDFRCSTGCQSNPSCLYTAGGCVHAQYKFYAYLRTEHLVPGWNRHRITEAINSQGVPCYQGSCSEVYLEKAFDNTGWRPRNRLPVAKEMGDSSLMFLVHPTLTEMEIQKACEVIGKVFSEVTT
jgi:dTDP-4-amino-4,6-dideoxygalactose transaminase